MAKVHRYLRRGYREIGVQVAPQQRALREDAERRAARRERGDDARHERVPALGPLVGVGVGAERDGLLPP